MSQSCKTGLRCAVGITEVTDGGRTASGIALSSLILSSLTPTDKVRRELPWLMFADYIVRCSKSRKQAEANLERWSYRRESREWRLVKARWRTFVYMRFKWNDEVTERRDEGFEVYRVNSPAQREYDKAVKKHEQAGWNTWIKVTRVKSICKKERKDVQDMRESDSVWSLDSGTDRKHGWRSQR